MKIGNLRQKYFLWQTLYIDKFATHIRFLKIFVFFDFIAPKQGSPTQGGGWCDGTFLLWPKGLKNPDEK